MGVQQKTGFDASLVEIILKYSSKNLQCAKPGINDERQKGVPQGSVFHPVLIPLVQTSGLVLMLCRAAS